MVPLLVFFLLAFSVKDGSKASADCSPVTRATSNGCPQLLQIPHGQINVASLDATIDCDDGFSIVGPTTITCNTTEGRWSNFPGICIYVTKVNFAKVANAIENDDTDVLEELLENGQFVNSQNGTGHTPLHLAAIHGSVKATRYLINNNADIHAITTSWQQPIHLAAFYDRLEIVEMLLERANEASSVVIEAIDEMTGRTPLFYAGTNGVKVAKKLLESGANHNHCDRFQMQPIHYAAANKQIELAKLLLEKDASLAQAVCCGSSKKTISHLAAESNFAQFLEELPNYFDPTAVDGEGLTPLCRIALHDGVEFAKHLQPGVDLANTTPCPLSGNANRRGSPMHLAAQHNSKKLIAWLVESGADIMERDSEGNTILHILASNPQTSSETELIGLLANHNSDIIDALDMNNRTAFHLAVIANSQTFADALLNEAGAVGNLVDSNGYSAFHHVKSQRFLSFLLGSIANSIVEVNRKSHHCLQTSDNECLKRGGITPLHVAVREKKPMEIIRHMINIKASNPNEVNDFGQSALHLAVEVTYRDAVTFLLKKGASAFIRDRLGRTALLTAVEQQDIAFVRALLHNSGESINVPNEVGERPINLAIRQNFTEALELFASSRHLNTKLKNSAGLTALLCALEAANEHATLILLNQAEISQPNEVNGKNQTALHLAVEADYSEAVSLLLNKVPGADPSAQDKHGRTALMLAVEKNNLHLVRTLLPYCNESVNLPNFSGQRPVDVAIKQNFSEVLIQLADSKQIDMSLRNADGLTPLLYALEDQNEHAALILLEHAEMKRPNDVNNHQQTALHLAVNSDYPEAIKLLLSLQGINTAQQDDGLGRTALMLALEKNNFNLVQILLPNSNNSINLPNKAGQRAIDLAIEQNFTEALTLLSQSKLVNMSLRNSIGQTPLLSALERKNEHAALIMLRHHAGLKSPNEVNNYHQTPLHLAVYAGYSDVVHLLLSKEGIDTAVQDAIGHTALMLAVEKGSLDFVRALMPHSNASLNLANHYLGLRQRAVDFAIKKNFTEALNLFAHSKHIDLSLKNSDGLTPLLYALESGNYGAASILLQHETAGKSWLNGQTVTNLETALHIAVRKNLPDLLETLVRKAANTSILNAKGNNPLHEAVISHQLGLVKLLAEDANVKIPSSVTSYGRNVFHLTSRTSSLTIALAELLIWRIGNTTDANVTKNLLSSRDAFGETPLHKAVSHENVDLVKLFLENGASCSETDHRLQTPLQLARHFRYDYLRIEMERFPQCRHGANCWSPDLAMCGKPPKMANGKIVQLQTKACGWVVECSTAHPRPGYSIHLEGLKDVQCNKEGQWEIGGICKGIKCNAIGKLPNGAIEVDGSLKCAAGYYLPTGTSKASRCDENGMWLTDEKCVQCDKANAIPNGDISADGSIKCSQSYYYPGSKKSQSCNKDGKWTANSCIRCDKGQTIHRGRIESDGTIKCDDYIATNCKAGLCDENGTWQNWNNWGDLCTAYPRGVWCN